MGVSERLSRRGLFRLGAGVAASMPFAGWLGKVFPSLIVEPEICEDESGFGLEGAGFAIAQFLAWERSVWDDDDG